MRPEIIKGRFYQRKSDKRWLARVDTSSSLKKEDAEEHCSLEYGFPVTCVELEMPTAEWDALVKARMKNALKPK